jgi:bacteriocin biosynthesis cyclodehydratase domain-containing protein
LQLLLRLHLPLQHLVAVSPQLPELPLLTPWYRLVEDGDVLVLEHGHRVVTLEGAAVRALLPRLLPLLDGTRPVAEIAATLGTAAEPAIGAALRLLGDNELLVDGPPPDCGAELRETAYLLAAETGASPAAAAGRLADAAVGVVGSGAAAGEAARLLRRSGIARVELRAWSDPLTDDLVVAAPGPDELVALGRWNDRCLEQEAAWLQVLPYDGVFAAVGPLFVPGDTACQTCYRLRREASLGIGAVGERLDGAAVQAGGGPALAVAAGATAALHALRWLATRDPSLPGVLFALEPRAGLRIAEHLVLRVPRCPSCSPLAEAAAPLPWFQPGVEAIA